MLPVQKIDALLARHAAVEAELSQQLASDQFVKLSRELAELTPVVEEIKAWRDTVKEIDDLKAMLSDPEMRDMAQAEIPALNEKRDVLEERIRIELLGWNANLF